MTTFRWLHLTDLHFGMPGQAPLWPNVEELFFDDLDYLRQQVGPWDMVLFTGDLTQRGTKPEFDELDKLLQRLWSRFAEWGFTPRLLAIPGNHDLVRPTDQSDPALITLLHAWNQPTVQTPFWDNANTPQRALLSTAFHNFTHWWEHTPIPKPAMLRNGLLPGDCSVSWQVGDTFTVGLVGLNSTFLQLTGGNFENKLHLDPRQLHGACPDGNGAQWTKEHDLCLLLTHHPATWLSAEAQQHFAQEIHSPPERFALHLCGHMHEANLSNVSHGGGGDRRQQQGTSLFGLETWGETGERRTHGYSLGELKLEGKEIKLRLWPRRAHEQQGGGRKLDRDQSFDLDKHDGGTRALVIKRIGRNSTVTSGQTVIEPPPAAGASYDPRNPPFSVPFRQKGDQVIGREEALEKVRQQLASGRRTAIGQTAVFQGLGGLGKTQLAVEYAYHYRDSYPNGVIWLTADQDLDAQLVDLAVKSHWIAPASEHRLKLEIAQHRLRSFSDCLIVFDNLEHPATIKEYLPEPPAEAHILVTSRTEQPDFTYVPINVLDPEQSLRLLTQEAGREPDNEADWTAAREIAHTLGGLPLALELAGAYLARRPVGWPRYLELLRRNLRQALPPRLMSLTRHEADLYSTLQVSEAVFTEEPRLQEIMDVLTWSGPAPMGLDLMTTLLDADGTELIGALGLGTALRILQQTPGTESYALHRLVREVRREQAPLASKSSWAADLCQRLGDWFTALREDFLQLPRFEAEIDHLQEWHDHSLSVAPQQASRLTWLQAYPPFHRGQAQEIKRLVELALDEYDRQTCDDLPLRAHLYNDLGYALNALGNPKEALRLAEQGLAIRRELFGERHPDTAESLNNVASYTNALGDSKEALRLAEQTLAIRRYIFGDRHPDTAASLHNVASYTNALGDPKEALRLAEQGLAIRHQLFGESHPDTAQSLNSVASYTNALGDPKGALRLAEQALAIHRQLFGESHPDTGASLHSVASYTNALGDPKGALRLAEQALAIHRQLFGESHPDTAQLLNSIAEYTDALGDPKEALRLAEQALAIQRQFFGNHHPAMALYLNNVASYTNALGNHEEALQLAEQALAIQRQLFGEHHPNTAILLNNVALYTGDLGDTKKALRLAEQALAIQRQLFGEHHPDTARSLHNKGSYLRTLGDMHRAYACIQKAFDIRRQLLGPHHPDTVSSATLLTRIKRPGFRGALATKGVSKSKKGKGRR